MTLNLLWLESVIKRHHHWSLVLFLLLWLLRQARSTLHIAAPPFFDVALHWQETSVLLDASEQLLLIPLVLVENICAGERGCLIRREQAQSVGGSMICAAASSFSLVMRIARVKLGIRWLPGRKDHILSLQAVDLIVRRDFQVAALIVRLLLDTVNSEVADGAWIRGDRLAHVRRVNGLMEIA